MDTRRAITAVVGLALVATIAAGCSELTGPRDPNDYVINDTEALQRADASRAAAAARAKIEAQQLAKQHQRWLATRSPRNDPDDGQDYPDERDDAPEQDNPGEYPEPEYPEPDDIIPGY